MNTEIKQELIEHILQEWKFWPRLTSRQDLARVAATAVVSYLESLKNGS